MKNREYCAKGIPFIIGYEDKSFKNCKFLYRVSNDNSLVNIADILEWYNNLKMTSEEIREFAIQNLSWDIQMKKVIDNISLSIKEKQTIALVGESGAGKTTLANIICGLTTPDAGNLLINNQIIKESQLNSYRSKIGYITQEAAIFNDTIFNNVTFWAKKDEASVTRFWKCIELVSLTNFIHTLDEKENTYLGNNGVLVSGGQKQRISIARELYKNIELLIMDEATSALDSETESYIKENIENLQGQYTMVIIAHRLSTIKHADCIYLIENGRIKNYGNYNELILTSKKFKKMVEIQNMNI